MDKKWIKTDCSVLEIKPQCLIKPKQIQKFNSKAFKPFSYPIYPILTIDTYTESFFLLLITKFENYFIIFGQLWIKKYGIIMNIINNFSTFWPSYHTYIRAIFPTILSQFQPPMEKVAIRVK